MWSEGYSIWYVCVCVTQILTFNVIIGDTSDTDLPNSENGRKGYAIFSDSWQN